MGLAGVIVRKVFSKSPCSSSAAGSRGHSEKASADHRRRWSSLRLYLCGEEMNATTEEEEEDGDTVSVKSFETTCCVMPTPEEAHVVVVPVAAPRPTSDDAHGTVDKDVNPAGEPDEEERSRVPAGGEQRHGHVVVVRVPACREEEEEEEEGAAATLVQSAFRGFMARRQLQELRTTRQEQQGMDGGAQDQEEPRTSPTGSASVATSVLVQVGESLSLGNLRLSEESASVQQQQRSSGQRSRPPLSAFRVKEWDDSTVSSNVSRMRIQSRIEATTRRERALAYAFSQQLRSCGGGGGAGGKKRSARAEQDGEEFNNVGWSWLERWMATRQAAEPQPAADDCMSRNADTGSASATAGRRVVVVRRRSNDLAVEEESCGSNDVVSVVSFDGSSSLGGGAARSGSLSCHKPPTGSKSRLKGGRSLPRRKQVAASDHRFQARSHKVSKKGHHRVEQAPHKDRLDAGGSFDFDDACQPPTDY